MRLAEVVALKRLDEDVDTGVLLEVLGGIGGESVIEASCFSSMSG